MDTRFVLLLFLTSIVNLGASGALDLNVLRNLQLRQTPNSPSKASLNGQCVALGDKLKEFNDNFAALYVAGNLESLKDLYTNDAIMLKFGLPPVFGEEAVERTGGYLAFFNNKFGNLARYELTLEDYGELDGGMVWATGNGSGYDSTDVDATPKTSMTYERVWKYDAEGNLRLAINAFVVNKIA